MRKLISGGLMLCGLLAGCASTQEKPAEPAPAESAPAESAPYVPEFKKGESPKNTTSEEGKAPVQQIVVTENPQPKDPLNIEGTRILRGVLDVSVAHGGGCRDHTYTLAWNGEFQQGVDGTPVANLVLVHDANGDNCKGIKYATPRFDLSTLRQRYAEKFGKASGTLDVALPQQPGQASLRYEF